jgi:hypothetical protein
VVYVAGDGSGDYKCDGKADDVQINQALEFAAENPAKLSTLKTHHIQNRCYSPYW